MQPLAPYILSVVFFVAIGCSLIFFPHVIRNYDTIMTRMIKDKEEYVTTCRIVGVIFLMIAIIVIPIFLFAPQD